VIVPDFLWAPSQKDLHAAMVAQRVARRNLLTVAAASITINAYIVPRDQVFWLTNFFVLAAGGGAQTVTRIELQMNSVDASGVFTNICQLFAHSPAAARSDLPNSPSPSQMCLAMLMDGEAITANGLFSAGVSANTLIADVTGILMPRGSFQLG